MSNPANQAARQALSLVEEFKNFALKGNVVDLAVGVIIGGAFGNIVKSLVDNIMMPVVSLITPGDVGYEKWAITIGEKTIPYGKFLGDIVSFLILALALFLFIVKFLGWIMRTKAAEPAPPSGEVVLLTEIRDLLAAGSRADGAPRTPSGG
jgi:large conductance mechanosensitive channel